MRNRKERNTHDGQAYWGGTGPDGKTCRECSQWQSHGYKSLANKAAAGILKDGPCVQFKKLTGGHAGPKFPHYARACKYFVEDFNPPPVQEKHRFA